MKNLQNFNEFLNEAKQLSQFPNTLKFVKETWRKGIRDNFGSGLGSTKNYHSFEWTDKSSNDTVDFFNKGRTLRLDHNSVEYKQDGDKSVGVYAEYKGMREPYGFSLKDINELIQKGLVTV